LSKRESRAFRNGKPATLADRYRRQEGAGMTGGEAEGRSLSVPLVPHGGEPFPAGVDIEPSEQRYVGFYENQHGEQLVFVHEKGKEPTLYHGDCGRDPVRAEWPQISTLIPTLSPWVTGTTILDDGEVLWLASCLAASNPLIGGESAGSSPLDRLAIQLIQRATKRESADFDRKWSHREVALERWRERQQAPPTHGEDHYAEGAILVALGVNMKQRKPRTGVTKEIRDRIEDEVATVVREVQ
jgi:hypothetical protein